MSRSLCITSVLPTLTTVRRIITCQVCDGDIEEVLGHLRNIITEGSQQAAGLHINSGVHLDWGVGLTVQRERRLFPKIAVVISLPPKVSAETPCPTTDCRVQVFCCCAVFRLDPDLNVSAVSDPTMSDIQDVRLLVVTLETNFLDLGHSG
jgi:hypothetical protein